MLLAPERQFVVRASRLLEKAGVPPALKMQAGRLHHKREPISGRAMEPLLLTLVILGLMAAVVIFFRSLVRRPRGISDVDPVGVRTVATFRGDSPEFFLQDHDGPLVGIQLFHALCDGLARAGIEIARRGTIQNAQRAECVVGQERFALVLEWIEGLWVAGVEWVPATRAEIRHLALTQEVFAPRDSLALRSLLATLDRWLKSQPQLADVRWYRKEKWIAEDLSDAGGQPLERHP